MIKQPRQQLEVLKVIHTKLISTIYIYFTTMPLNRINPILIKAFYYFIKVLLSYCNHIIKAPVITLLS